MPFCTIKFTGNGQLESASESAGVTSCCPSREGSPFRHCNLSVAICDLAASSSALLRLAHPGLVSPKRRVRGINSPRQYGPQTVKRGPHKSYEMGRRLHHICAPGASRNKLQPDVDPLHNDPQSAALSTLTLTTYTASPPIAISISFAMAQNINQLIRSPSAPRTHMYALGCSHWNHHQIPSKKTADGRTQLEVTLPPFGSISWASRPTALETLCRHLARHA